MGYRINRTPEFSGGGYQEIFRSLEFDELKRFVDKDVTDGTNYIYNIQAIDRGGNYSAATSAITVKVGVSAGNVDTNGGNVKFDACELIFAKGSVTGPGQVVIKKSTADLPENKYAIKLGSAYSFTLLDQNGREIEAKFEEPVKLTVSYVDLEIPEGFNPENLGVYWYNQGGGYWEKLEYAQYDFIENEIIVDLLHFSDYQVMASRYMSPSLDSYYNMGVSPLQAYFQDNTENVSPMNGSLTVSATDFKLPGRGGLGIVIQRIYDSTAANHEMMAAGNHQVDSNVYRTVPIDTFGYGWSLNIPWIEETDKGKFVRLPQGQTIKIEPDSNGVFKYHKGIHFVFEIHTTIVNNKKVTTGYTLTMNDGTVYEFDSNGRAIKCIDPSGINEIRYTYNNSNKRELSTISYIVDKQTGQSLYVVNFHYTSTNNGQKRVIDSISVGDRTVNYQYDDTGNLLEVEYPLERKTTYAYEFRLIRSGVYTKNSKLNDDEEDNTFSYNVPLLKTITYPTGEQSIYEFDFFDQFHQETIEKKVLGVTILRTRISYYGTKFVVKNHKFALAGQETNYSYGMNGLLGSIKGENFIPAYTYMKTSRLTQTGRMQENIFSQIEGNAWIDIPKNISKYEGPLLIESVIKIGDNQEFEQVKYGYDVPLRAIILENHYRGGEFIYQITSQYDDWGNLTFRKNGSNNLEEAWTYYDHNRFKNLPEIYTQKNFNPVKNIHSTVTTTYQYDSVLGKPLTVMVNDGLRDYVTRFTYDDYGNVKTKIEEYNDNLRTEIFYDDTYQVFPVKHIIYGVKDADGNSQDIITEVGYDFVTGLKQWEKDARGFVTRYEYDALNRMKKVVLPNDDNDKNNPYREYIFNDEDNTCEFINEKGQATTYRFDGLGRLIEVVKDTSIYPEGVRTSYHYNNQGQIDRVIDPRGNITEYQYDGLNRVIQVIYPGGAYITMNYDDATNTVTVTDEEGGVVTERKDWANRLVEAKQYCAFGTLSEIYTWTFAYDSQGNKLRQVDPLLKQTDQEYNALGRLVRSILPIADLILPGNTSAESYRPVLIYGYDDAGNKVSETSANGNASGDQNHKVEYKYDQLGRKIQVTTKATDILTGTVITSITKYYYDAAGNKIKMVDPNNGEWTYTYSARGWLLSETDPTGNTTRYQYDILGNKIAVTDPRGNGSDGKFTTWYVYDDLNRLHRTILPDTTPPANPYLDPEDNPYTQIDYDENGNKIKERDANGVITSYEYTDRNWLWKVIDAKGRVQTEYTYDKKGNQIEVKDALGRTIKKSYDSLGRLRKVTDALNNSEEYSYNAVGNKTAVTDARGSTTYYEYNSLGWLTEVRDPLGNTSLYSYDPNGNQVKLIAPNGLATTNRYDELNRIIETFDSLGNPTKYSYDPVGNQKRIIDRRGTVWDYQYYSNNLLQWAEATGTDGTSYWVEYTYDKAGNRKTVRDSGNEIHYNLAEGVYQPDPLNRVNNIERRFDGATYRTAYQYDKAGLVKGILYPEALSMVEYKYNDLNQLTEVAGFTTKNGVKYNTDGSVQSLTYANGAIAVYNYDLLISRLNQLKVTVAGRDLLNLSYTYDEVSNIKTITDNDKLKTFEYDKNNQLTKAVTPGTFLETIPTPGTAALKTNDVLGNGIFEFTPILSGLMGLDYYSSSIGIDFGSVASAIKVIELVPDKDYSTHRITENTIALYISNDNINYTLIPRTDWDYQKDDKGVITLTLKEKLATRYLKLHVKYDERGRNFEPVNKATFLNEIAKMLRVYQEAESRTEEYQYDAAGNRKITRVTLVQTAEFASLYYTNSDRLKTDGKYAFAYDNAGNMVKKGNVFEISGDTVNFTTSGEGVEYWEYEYDLLNRLIKVTKNGTIVAEYAYDPEGLRVVKRAKGETTHYVFEGTEPIFEKRINAGKAKSYVYSLGKYLARVDGVIGDPEAKKYFYHTDHAGSIRVVTDQSGKVVFNADYLAFGTRFVKDGDFEELHGFTGKEYDPDIGLYYFNARWYDPDLGRFISEDPAGDPNNPNLYSYGANNPVMMIDPSGQFVWSWLTFFKAIFTSWVWGALQTADVIHEEGGDFWKGFWYGLWGKPTIGIRINFDGNGNYSIGPRDEDVRGGIEYPGEVYGGYYDESYEQFQSDQYGIGGDVLGPLSELLFGAYFNEPLEGIKSSAQLGYRNPLKGDFLVTSPFHQIRSIGSTPHLGIDFGAPIGTPVLATADGIVVFAGLHGSLAGPGQKRGTGFGYCIVIYHGQDSFGNHVTTMYSHLSEFAPDVTVGQKVQWGQEIGKVGSTGLSTGPHLDYTLLVTDHIPFRINNGVLEIERNIDTAKDPQHYPWTGL